MATEDDGKLVLLSSKRKEKKEVPIPQALIVQKLRGLADQIEKMPADEAPTLYFGILDYDHKWTTQQAGRDVGLYEFIGLLATVYHALLSTFIPPGDVHDSDSTE